MNLTQQIRRLQQQLDRQSQQIEALRRQRRRRHGRELPVRLAKTAEEAPAGGGSHGYPVWAADTAELPIVFVDLHKPSTTLTRTERSEYANATALATFGWLPPEVEVEVTQQDDGKWRIVRCPIALRGKLESGIGAASASWSGSGYTGVCDEWADGQAYVHVYRLNRDSPYDVHGATYTPQQYSNGDDVLMKVNAVTNVAIGEENLVNFRLNADRQWEIDIAWCSGAPTCD